MANWLTIRRSPGVVFSWLARRRQRKAAAEQAPKAPLRRRASFPVYKPLTSGSVTPNSTSGDPKIIPNTAFNSVRSHHTLSAGTHQPPQPTQTTTATIQQMQQQQPAVTGGGGLYVPPGYVYKTSEGRVGNRRVTVSTSAYPGHFLAPPQPTTTPSTSGASTPNATVTATATITGAAFTPSHSRTASAPSAYHQQPPQVYGNVTPSAGSTSASKTITAASLKERKRASSHQHQQQPQIQFYYDPRTVTSTTTMTAVMTQLPTATPVSMTTPAPKTQVLLPQTSTMTPLSRTSVIAPSPSESRTKGSRSSRSAPPSTSANTSSTRRQAPAPPSTPRPKSSSRTPLAVQPQPQQQQSELVVPTPTTSKRPRRASLSAPTDALLPTTTPQPYNSSPRKVIESYARYTSFLQSAPSSARVTFASIPWPTVDPPKHPTSLNVNAVRSFLLSPHHSQGVPARERVEHAQSVWEPRVFMATWGARIRDEEEREKVERTLGFLQGTLRILFNEVVAAEV